jgi:hypothetical protein
MADDERVYLIHKETGGTTETPNDPVVLKDYESRGWEVAERPGPVPFIPSPDGLGGRKLDPKDYNPVPVSAPEDTKPKKVK